MRLRPLVALPLLVAAFAPADARADLIPEGYKSVKMSMQIDASVPADKSLVLGHTFRGADVVETGKVMPIEWHPLGGPLQLRLVDAAAAGRLGPLREAMDRDAINAIVDAATACSEPIEGVRTIADASAAVEVRWTLTVAIEGTSCKTTAMRRDFLDASGAVVAEPADVPPLPAGAVAGKPGDAAPAKAVEPAKTAEPAKTEEPAKAAEPVKSAEAAKAEAAKSAGGCACDASAGGGASMLPAVVLAGAWRRRRR